MKSSFADGDEPAIDMAALLDALPAHIALLDARGRILGVNASWRSFASDHPLAQPSVGEAYRLPCQGGNAREQALMLRAQEGVLEVASGSHHDFTMEYPCHEGQARRWFELTATAVPGRPGALVTHSDITARHLAQAGVLRLNRLYAVAIHVNEAIVHLSDERELFQQACRIAVEQGGLLMAWVGVPNASTGKFGISGFWGADKAFLNAMALSTEADIDGGDGPAGRAYRGGVAVTCNDIAGEPGPFVGRDIALALGYRSCAALPLTVAGVSIGVYVAYADTVGFFDTEVTRLMTTLATNFSFAVEARRRAKAQRADVEGLRQSQALLRIASRLGRIGAWTLDLRGGEVQWSDEVCDIHGAPRGYAPTVEEALAFYPPEYRSVVSEGMAECVRTGESFTHELQIVTTAGERVWVRTTAEAQRDESGAIVRLQGAFQDITARKLRDEENRALSQRLASTLENITDAFMTIDRDWRFSYANNQAVRLLRRPSAELMGMKVWDLFPEAVGGRFQHEYERALADNVPVEFEEYFGPLSTWFEVHAYPSDHGLAIYFRDVSAARAAHEEILRLNEGLEERVRERTAQLQAANRELEAFSYSIAHDLRGPLRSIEGFSHLLERAMPPSSGERSMHYLARIRASARLMSEMTDALLGLAQVSRTGMVWGEVDLSAVATRILDGLREHAPERALDARVQPGMTAQGDARLLAMVMENLIGNAWKFSANVPIAQISVGTEVIPGGEVAFFVKDNGAGFDMAHAAKLFGVFERLHAASEFAGTGIGLANVSRIVARHGGRAWAVAKPAQGACFFFTLGSPPLAVDVQKPCD